MTTVTPPLLRIDGLSVTIRTERDSLTVVDSLSMAVAPDEVLCIVGESGSGKSVTMLSVMRLMDERAVDYAGAISFDGQDLLALSQREMRRSAARASP